MNSKYMDAVDISVGNKKTKVYIISSKDYVRLGTVAWDCGWRRYCFYPNDSVMFDSQCLKDISTFLDKLMNDRKEVRAK